MDLLWISPDPLPDDLAAVMSTDALRVPQSAFIGNSDNAELLRPEWLASDSQHATTQALRMIDRVDKWVEEGWHGGFSNGWR